MTRSIEVDIDDFDEEEILAAADRIRAGTQLFDDTDTRDMRDLTRLILNGEREAALALLERTVAGNASVLHVVQTTRARASVVVKPVRPEPLGYWGWVQVAMRLRDAVGVREDYSPLETVAIEAALEIERMCGSIL